MCRRSRDVLAVLRANLLLTCKAVGAEVGAYMSEAARPAAPTPWTSPGRATGTRWAWRAGGAPSRARRPARAPRRSLSISHLGSSAAAATVANSAPGACGGPTLAIREL
ncbi:hypothetical protein SAMD00023353_9200420 [Rosellinia necatrix]|uniref:Uncharacterized protein n=1 Tax=Rosellinia necatrix TaxID=77044 RepID=A0A1W2TVF7_ROSNE|nr:hypothetical protein SAMD00023353_9200420 [Rosellinia necatrix]